MHVNSKKEEAIEVLFTSHFESLCRFAAHYINDFEQAKDIVHEVFIKLWEKYDALPNDTNFKSYLFTAVRNKSFNFIRDKKQHLTLEEVHETKAPDNSDQLEIKELENQIADALNQLPDACRNVFELSRFEALKYTQIAERLGISVKTVEAQMSKALRILRNHLKDFLILLFFWWIT